MRFCGNSDKQDVSPHCTLNFVLVTRNLLEAMSNSKEAKGPCEKAIIAYTAALRKRPILTKGLTSGTIAAIGNILSQIIVPNEHNGGKIMWRSVAAYAAYGGIVSGPLIHYFYILLDKIMPQSQDKKVTSGIKRVLIDRVLFAPPFLLLFLYVVSIMEGAGHAGAIEKIKIAFIPVLLLNWKIWTPFQFINVTYVPQKYRVLFGNFVALIWAVYVAVKRRQLTQK